MNPYSIKDVSIKMKNKFSRISFVAVLAATIATVGLMAGCGSGESSSEAETKVVTETQIVTKVVNGVLTDENGNPIKDAQGNTVTAPAGTPDTDKSDKSSKTEKNESQASGSQSSAAQSSANQSSGSQSSKSNSGSSSDKQSSNNAGSDKSSSSKSGETPAKSSGDLKIGNQYFNVGDTVTCTYSLTCPKDFINFQATLNYDSSKLKATNAKMQGEAAGGAVVNHKLDGKVKFNGIKLGGYDYSDGGAFMIVTYEVVGKGEVSPSISWEVVTDMDMNPMISNGQLDSSFKITDKYE